MLLSSLFNKWGVPPLYASDEKLFNEQEACEYLRTFLLAQDECSSREELACVITIQFSKALSFLSHHTVDPVGKCATSLLDMILENYPREFTFPYEPPPSSVYFDSRRSFQSFYYCAGTLWMLKMALVILSRHVLYQPDVCALFHYMLMKSDPGRPPKLAEELIRPFHSNIWSIYPGYWYVIMDVNNFDHILGLLPVNFDWDRLYRLRGPAARLNLPPLHVLQIINKRVLDLRLASLLMPIDRFSDRVDVEVAAICSCLRQSLFHPDVSRYMCTCDGYHHEKIPLAAVPIAVCEPEMLARIVPLMTRNQMLRAVKHVSAFLRVDPAACREARLVHLLADASWDLVYELVQRMAFQNTRLLYDSDAETQRSMEPHMRIMGEFFILKMHELSTSA